MKRTFFDQTRHDVALRKSPLFAHLDEAARVALIRDMRGYVAVYERGESVYAEGDQPAHIGVVLGGSVDVVQVDFLGNRVLIGRFHIGQCFAESSVIARADSLAFSVVAAVRSEILMLPHLRAPYADARPRPSREQLVDNLLYILARKNLGLVRKIDLLTRPSVRQKVLSYLRMEATKAGSNRFTIEFNRQGLANYLVMDRTTLSNELSKLQKEGLISYKKNTFEIHRRRRQKGLLH